MTSNISFQFNQQSLVVLKQLHTLGDLTNLPENLVLFDCGSFNEKENHKAVLCFQTLIKNFHIIIIKSGTFLPDVASLHKSCYTVLNNVPLCVLRNVKNPYEHIATQIMAYIAEQNSKYKRKAYFCLSADHSFPLNTEVIDAVGREFIYCCALKVVADFVALQKSGHFSENYEDPTKMRLYHVLQNNVSRDFDPKKEKKGGKLMHFIRHDYYIRKENIKLIWQELKKFGDENSLHVNVTTDFPSVDYLVIQEYPEITKPKYYRYLIYLPDASEYETLSTLELLLQHSPLFRHTVWSIKDDKATKEKQFGSLGHRDIAKAVYKMGFSSVSKKIEGLSQYSSKTYEHLQLYDKHVQDLLYKAKQKGAMIKVRHAKILFCGASGAGKTSFCHLLKHKPFNEKHISTGLGDTQQVMVSVKATMKDNVLIELDPAEEIHQLKLRLKYKKLSDNDETILIAEEPTGNSLNIEHTTYTCLKDKIPSKADLLFNSFAATNKLVQPTLKLQCNVDKQLASTVYNREKELKEPPPIWDVLTLLDTGGQPQFINMLPAVNTSATITFVVLNMMGGVKMFDEQVQVCYNKDGNVPCKYKPYPMNYTNKDLIKCLIALLKDSIVRNIPPLTAEEYVSKVAKESRQGLCFVGTHLDKVKQEDVNEINEKLDEIVRELEASNSINILCLNKILLAVDNTVAGKECPQNTIVNKIQLQLKEMMENLAVYDVPITWVILELEIRQECSKKRKSFLPILDVVRIYNNISNHDMTNAELQVRTALQFHHRFGVLLYFHDVPGMNQYVISNSQWLFANLTNLVSCSFEETFVIHGELDKFKSSGILSKHLIEKINTDSLEGISIDYFLELLKYLKIITPFPERDSSDYLTLTILDSYKGQSKILGDSPSKQSELLMQFQSGTFPRGIFSCLVVQLVENKSDEWELQTSKNCIYQNLVTFYIKTGYYLFIIDKISHLEIHLRPIGKISKSVYCDVQQSITVALLVVCPHSQNDLKYGFYCKYKPCLKPIMKLSIKHMTGKEDIPLHVFCEEHGFMELTTHKLWCKTSDDTVDKLLEPSTSTGSTHHQSQCKEAIIFKEKYQHLLLILSTSITELIPHFIAVKIITVDDESEIRCIPTKSDQADKVLKNIAMPLECGITICFYEMLNIMKQHGNLATTELAHIIEDAL